MKTEAVKKNCAFQYYDGVNMRHDEINLTMGEAKELFNKYHDEMVMRVELGYFIEVAIWINMKHNTDYRDTLIHLSNPEVSNGEFKYYDLY